MLAFQLDNGREQKKRMALPLVSPPGKKESRIHDRITAESSQTYIGKRTSIGFLSGISSPITL